MKVMLKILAGLLVTPVFFALTARAQNVTLSNPSFETGTTSGWTVWTNNNNDAAYIQKGGSAGTYNLANWKTSAYQAKVSQTVTGLQNGNYSLTAMIQNGGGQKACYLFTQNSGGANKFTSLPVSNTWTKVIIRGINVTNGQCVIGLWSDANAGNWCKLDDVKMTKDNIAYNFLQGGDISELSYEESKGAKYYDNSVQTDCVQILHQNGCNFVRLRAFVDPGNPSFSPSNLLPTGFQTTADILSLARRAHAQGMSIQLTLNYSDYWADGSTQNSPHAWVGMSFANVLTALYNYTYDIVHQMVLQGTPPAFVSLGNQMQSGLLLQPNNQAPVSNWTNLAQLLNKGSDAVKSASPTSKVMLHIDSPVHDGFFSQAIANGVRFDVMGVSWYPYWNRNDISTLPALLTKLNTITSQYNKDVVVMECGVNWNPLLSTGNTGQLPNNGNVGYAQTPEGQRDFLYDLFNTLKNVNNGRCLGILYWDPVMVNQAGVGWELGQPNVVDNSTLFDWNHNALPGLKQGFLNGN
jgi:arabinogalactan endo-1,4-beta-galactosidase